MRTFAFLAVAAVVVSARGATVRTASENWVTNRIAQAVAPLCTMIAAKADDSSVVHTNGDETIAGVKIFSDYISVPVIFAGGSAITIGVSGRIQQSTAGGLINDTILPNYGEVKAELAGYLPLEGGEIVGDLSVAVGGLTLYGTEFPTTGGTWITWYRDYVKLSSGRRIYIPTPTGDTDDFALRSDIPNTASEVGALPISGGTLTGNLTVGSTGDRSEIRAEHGNEYLALRVKNNTATIETGDYTYSLPRGGGTLALYEEIPAWALAPTKPTYTASEIGATTPAAVSNIVTTAYVREKLGVYLYVGQDGGIYVHTNEN